MVKGAFQGLLNCQGTQRPLATGVGRGGGVGPPVYLGESLGLNKCQGLGKKPGEKPLHSPGSPPGTRLAAGAPITPRNTAVPSKPLLIYLMLPQHPANFN